MTINRHLIVFAKAPKLGAVKTRLAADIGDEQALKFYRQTLMGLMARMAIGESWRCWISLTPDEAASGPAFWPDAFEVVRQGAGNLGERMARSFHSLPPGPAILIGADIPAIELRHIDAAFQALDNHDAVFGPAADGGYWLVGSNRAFAAGDIFKNVRWSSEHALADTLGNISDLGKTAARIDTLEDIDDGAAYRNWLKDALLSEA